MLKSIGNGILVKESETKGAEMCEKLGNLVIPTSSNEYDIVEVLSVGDQVNSPIEIGNTLLIYPGAGKKIKVDGEDFRVVNISEVIAIKLD